VPYRHRRWARTSFKHWRNEKAVAEEIFTVQMTHVGVVTVLENQRPHQRTMWVKRSIDQEPLWQPLWPSQLQNLVETRRWLSSVHMLVPEC
jgi:hypothetical protein